MKTSPLQMSLVISIMLLTSFSVHASTDKIRTNAVKYNNTWIPSVELKEVTVTAKALDTEKGQLCQMVKHYGKYIASVQLNEVSVNASGIYSEEIKPVAVKAPVKVKMIPAVLVNGEYIAHVNLPEITITADNMETASVSEQGSTNDGEVPQVGTSVRKTFDRLAGYLLEKGKFIVRKMAPSWLGQ